MCKRRKRNSFILVEVLVASSLFVLLLVAIFGIFWRTSKINASLNSLRKENEHLLICQARLQNVFSNLSYAKNKRPYFFIEGDSKSLICTINNKAQLSDSYANVVLGKLYIENTNLCLAMFPHFKTSKGLPEEMRKEILLEGVSDLSYEFFMPPVSQEEDVVEEEATKKPPTGKWTTTWMKEYEQFPTLVKITVERTRGGKYTFWFFLPDMIKPIVYEKR